ncbi:MAG: sigma-70 family RNA polymerase sigma factor [Myxococcales bacterium]|nr:sigma-70 family RNA polymerase sigma factor [Myxococcales bacterium]
MRDFQAIYRQEFRFVWATARRLGVPPASVEDVVQDVFLTAYRRMDQVHFEVSPRAWLHGVTRRVASRYRRTAARRHRRHAAAAALPTTPGEPPQERIAAAQHLERLLGRLGGRTRAAFEMAELLGMSGPEIAGELGISVSTVYSRVRLAREQLARHLGGDGLERALGEVREGDTPPRAAETRGWAILVPGLASTGTSTGVGVGAWASVRGAVIAAVILSAGAGALAWPRIRGEGRASPPSAASEASARGRAGPRRRRAARRRGRRGRGGPTFGGRRAAATGGAGGGRSGAAATGRDQRERERPGAL